jgi:DNA-binding response OmpR family regulator
MRYVAGLAGVDCDIADSGTKALDMLGRNRYSAVVLAVFVPEINGFRLCRVIRDVYADMPVIFYSGAATDDERRRGLKAGADAYLLKPNDFDVLLKTIESIGRNASRTSIAA